MSRGQRCASNVVARPTEVAAKAAAALGAGELTEVRKLQLEWWTAFRQALVESNAVPLPRPPGLRYWYDVPLGRAGIHLSNIANTYDHKIGVRFCLRQRQGGDAALARLLEWKEEIEGEIGEPLQWNPNPENRDKTIALYRDADLGRRHQWPEYVTWMVDRTLKFRRASSPRLRMLSSDSEDLQSADETGA